MRESQPPPQRDESPFDLYAVDYDMWFDREGRTIFEIEVRAFQGLLPSLPKPWIEVGVGSGRFAEALGIPTGIDPSEKLKGMAEERDIRVTKGRGENRLFPEGSFGTAFIIVTLCFVDEPLPVIERTAEMLKESGRLVLGLITKESPWASYYMRKREEGHPFYSIATFYSYGEIMGLLREGGFVHERTVSTLFQRPGQVDHMEAPREGFHAESGFTVMQARRESAP